MLIRLDDECCDGSDEYATPGLCPDRCREIGEKYRAEQDALLKTRKTVSHPCDAA